MAVVIQFQFQYGTIGRMRASSFANKDILFQFQYGTIGRLTAVIPDYTCPLFQFQYGTIGRSENLLHQMFYLVSIPVWYDWKKQCRQSPHLSPSFQFQYGTIGSELPKTLQRGIPSFNSSMVRLEAGGEGYFLLIPISFNSSMVRLEVLEQRRAFQNIMFQFQYGTIGSLSDDLPERHEIVFQFQYGTLGRLNLIKLIIEFGKFQFQYGTIGRNNRRNPNRYVDGVSIPVWYDWKSSPN